MFKTLMSTIAAVTLIFGLGVAMTPTAQADDIGIRSSLALGGIYLKDKKSSASAHHGSLGPKQLRYHRGGILRHKPRVRSKSYRGDIGWRKAYRKHGRPIYKIHPYDGYVRVFRHKKLKKHTRHYKKHY